jgi:hypothetical protein
MVFDPWNPIAAPQRGPGLSGPTPKMPPGAPPMMTPPQQAVPPGVGPATPMQMPQAGPNPLMGFLGLGGGRMGGFGGQGGEGGGWGFMNRRRMG